MEPSVAFEHALEGAQLVRGKGSRRRGQFCVMSLAAFLAGERHTDAPRTVSRFIRAFGIVLNDGLPDDLRQRLKPLVPRLIGTDDGMDAERAELLVLVMSEEIVPKLRAAPGNPGYQNLIWEWDRLRASNLRRPQWAWSSDRRRRLAHGAARLVVKAAEFAPAGGMRDGCFVLGIELLDRLCDIGGSNGWVGGGPTVTRNRGFVEAVWNGLLGRMPDWAVTHRAHSSLHAVRHRGEMCGKSEPAVQRDTA